MALKGVAGRLDYRAVRGVVWRLPAAWRQRAITQFVRNWMPQDGQGAVESINRAQGALWRLRDDVASVDRVAVVARLPEGWREVNATSTEDDIVCLAHDQARECALACSSPSSGMMELRARLRDWGLVAPHKTDAGIAGRMCNARWWRRRLRSLRGRCVERAAMSLRMLGGRAQRYCTFESESLYLQQRERSRAMMEDVVMVSEAGRRTTLLAAHDASVSNPALRLAEMVTRVKGHESVAREKGDSCLFVTLTCPSKYHAVKIDGRRNDKWQGATAREAQAYLRGVWASVRKRMLDAGVFMHGVRIVEPHHDGCPHWHLLVWLAEGSKTRFVQIASREALRVDGQEHGAARSRIQFVGVRNDGENSAVGYLLKYIVKNIPSQIGVDASCLTGIATNEVNHIGNSVINDGVASPKSTLRPMVWARVWGIRQFQFFGSASVSLWRTLRKMPLTCFDAPVRAVVDLCHREGDRMADYATFLREACGGRFGVPLVGFAALKGWSDKANQYGEAQGVVTIGLASSIGLNYHHFRDGYRVARATWTCSNKCPGGPRFEGAVAPLPFDTS